jgi:acetolactate synthase-1/2/3 large subunit
VIHADIDPAEIGKNRYADVPIVGDARRVIVRPHRGLPTDAAGGQHWRLRGVGPDSGRGPRSETYPLGYDTPERRHRCRRSTSSSGSARSPGPEAIYVAGVGQHQMWAAQFIKYEKPQHVAQLRRPGHHGLRRPGGDGRQGRPPRPPTVWAIDGDGCFQMTNQELATCAINDIPIKVALINNGSLGMVRQWQTLFYNERYSNTDLHTHSAHPGLRQARRRVRLRRIACERPEDVDDTIEKAMAINDRPVVIDFVVGATPMVWPMVPPAPSNDEIMAPATRPRLDNDERTCAQSIDTHTCPSSSRTSPACWPASPRCSPGAASTSSRSPSAHRAQGRHLADDRRRRRRGDSRSSRSPSSSTS